MNQRGFATLEVILMVMVIGILASIAVPRFTSVTAAANTAKIQADRSTIDTAIAIYVMEGNTISSDTTDISVLKDYINDVDNLEPPTGKCYMNDKDDPQDIPKEKYKITKPDGETEYRATLNGKTASYFTKKASSTNNAGDNG